MITVKVFNLLLKELAPLILKKGVWVRKKDLAEDQNSKMGKSAPPRPVRTYRVPVKINQDPWSLPSGIRNSMPQLLNVTDILWS